MLSALITIWPLALSSFLAALVTCLAIVRWFAERGPAGIFEAHDHGVQAIHTQPTPRLGGVALLAGLCVGILLAWPVLASDGSTLLLLFVTALPVFVAGLWDDLYDSVAPRWRLIGSAASGGLFVAATGQWMWSVDVQGLDGLLAAAPAMAVAFTIFACAGATHAVNLIDGLNGLAGGFGVAAALCLALFAHEAGLAGHVIALTLLAATIAGFLVVNFPMGKIFLGDAGAYAIGHILAWAAVSILAIGNKVSAFALLLIFFWPVSDTCFAIARRLYAGRPIGKPDRHHFHHIIYAAVSSRFAWGDEQKLLANSASSLVILPLMIAPMIAGVVLMDNVALSAACALGFVALYVFTYLALGSAAKGSDLGEEVATHKAKLPW